MARLTDEQRMWYTRGRLDAERTLNARSVPAQTGMDALVVHYLCGWNGAVTRRNREAKGLPA